MKIANLFHRVPPPAATENVAELLARPGLRLERIVSRGHATPAGTWYDQEEDEWVLLLSGSAGLRVEGEPELLVLQPGDYLELPAHCRHRVEWTDPDRETIWLALHYRGEG